MKVFEVNNRLRTSRDRLPVDVIIFHHIPKTAGACVQKLLVPDIRREPQASWAGLELAPAAIEAASPDQSLSDGTYMNWVIPSKEMCRDQPRLMWGHNVFGYHQEIGLTATYATILRDPIERFVSEYFWIAQLPDSPIAKEPRLITDELVRDVDRLDNANFQTYNLTGFNWTRPMKGYTLVMSFAPGEPRFNEPLMTKYGIDEAIGRARENLRTYFSFVGINELLAESLLVMADTYGWKHLAHTGNPLTRINHAVTRPAVSELPISTRRKLDRITEADQILYDSCRQSLEGEFSRADFGPTHAELKSHMGLSEVSSSPYFHDAARIVLQRQVEENQAHQSLIDAQRDTIARLEGRVNELVIEKLKRELETSV